MSDELTIEKFQGDKIQKVYPCGEKRTGVPYAKDLWLSGEFLVRTSKTRTVEGPAAEKIAENVAKFDKEKGGLSKAFMALRKSFSK